MKPMLQIPHAASHIFVSLAAVSSDGRLAHLVAVPSDNPFENAFSLSVFSLEPLPSPMQTLSSLFSAALLQSSHSLYYVDFLPSIQAVCDIMNGCAQGFFNAPLNGDFILNLKTRHIY